MDPASNDQTPTDPIAQEQLKVVTERLREGVAFMRQGNHRRALHIFESVYKSEDLPKPVTGLSYYGLCLASVNQQHRAGIALCEKAIQEKPNDVAHYANLVETYESAGRRRKAIDFLNSSIKQFPRARILQDLKEKLGKRKRPVIPFLPRGNIVNVILGHMRHTLFEKKEKRAR